MGNKTFDFRQFTLLQGLPRMTPIIQLSTDVDERSDHKEDNKPKEKVLIKKKRNHGQIIDLGGKPKDDPRTDKEKNEDYWSPLGGAWERNKSLWNNDKHIVQGLGKTAGVAAAVASVPYAGAASDAIGLTKVAQKAITNPYVQATLSSAGLADSNTKILNGEVGKDVGQDLFTVMEYVPYLGTALKYADNIPNGAVQLYKDLKHLPHKLKRKANASKRIDALYKQKQELLEANEAAFHKGVEEANAEWSRIERANNELINKHEKEARALKDRMLEAKARRGSPNVSKAIRKTKSPFEVRGSRIDFSKLSEKDVENISKKYPHLAKNIIKIDGRYYLDNTNNSFYKSVETAPKKIPIYGTDETIEASVTTPSGGKTPLSNFSTVNRTYDPSIAAQGDVTVDPKYVETMRNNIAYVLNEFPGSVPFGSSVGVAQAGFPHVTDDIDLFIPESKLAAIEHKYGPRNTWYQKVKAHGTDPGPQTYTVELENGRYGFGKGSIDLNVLYSDPDTGMATGNRAMELFRQLFPDEYQKALLHAERTKTPIKINKTPEELAEAITPSKTIMDSFEADKPKHKPRSLVYLQDGDPDQVYDALRKYYESFLGSKVKHAPINESQFTDVESNKQLLKQMGFDKSVNIDKIASDPKRMRNAYQLWWMENTSYGRGADLHGDLDANGIQYMTTLGGTGGRAAGPGLNTVLFGNSGHTSHAYAVNQPHIEGITEGMSPQDLLNLVRRNQGKNINPTPEQIEQLKAIAAKYRGSIDSFDDYSLFNLAHNISQYKTPEADADVYKIGEILGINGMLGGNYGNSTYFGGMRPFNRPSDLLRFVHTENAGSKIYPIPLSERLNFVSRSDGADNFFVQKNLRDIQDDEKHYRHLAIMQNNSLYKNDDLDNLAIRRIREKLYKTTDAIKADTEAARLRAADKKDLLKKKRMAQQNSYHDRGRALRRISGKLFKPDWGAIGGITAGAGVMGGLGYLLYDSTRGTGDIERFKLWNPTYKDFIDTLTPEELRYVRNYNNGYNDFNKWKSWSQLLQEVKDQRFDEKRKKK